MKSRLLTIMLFLWSVQISAVDLSAPPGSALSEIPEQARENYLRKFEGSITLVGTFTAAWELVPVLDGENSREDLILRVVFVPDQPSSDALPHFIDSPLVSELYLWPAEEAVEVLVPPPHLKALLAQEITEVKGDASITIEAYTADIICDKPVYSAHPTSADPIKIQQTARKEPVAVPAVC